MRIRAILITLLGILYAAVCIADVGATNKTQSAPSNENVHKKDLRYLKEWQDEDGPPPTRELVQRLEEWVKRHEDDAESLYWLAGIYEDESGTLGLGKDRKAAIDLLKRAAEMGFPAAQSALAAKYYEGEGVKKDVALAVRLTKKAAGKNDPRAIHQLGFLHFTGIGGFKKDSRRAIAYFNKAAELGCAGSLNLLGVLYLKGFDGVPKDPIKAFAFTLKAAKRGHVTAQSNLSVFYQDGTGTEKDPKMAFYWAEKAAKKGHSLAMCRLGLMYECGLGVNPDPVQAIRWYKKSAEKGDTQGQIQLSKSYMKGVIVQQDVLESTQWLRLAAEGGDAKAQYELARRYLIGATIDRNVFKAEEWLEKAAKRGTPADLLLALRREKEKFVIQHITPSVVAVIAFDKAGKVVAITSGLRIEDNQIVTARSILNGATKLDITTSDGEKSAVGGILADDPEAGIVMLSAKMPVRGEKRPGFAKWYPQELDKLLVINKSDSSGKCFYAGIVQWSDYMPFWGWITKFLAVDPNAGESGVAVNMSGEIVGLAILHNVEHRQLRVIIPVDRLARLEPKEVVSLGKWNQRRDSDTRTQTTAKLYRAGLHCVWSEDPKNALKYFSKVVASEPQNARAQVWIGVCKFMLKDYDGAISAYKKAIQTKPDMAEAYFCLAGACRDLKRLEEGIQACRKAVQINPDSLEAHLLLGSIYIQAKQYKESVKSLREAIKIRPDCLDAWDRLSSAYLKAHEWHKAIESARKAIGIKSDYAHAYFSLATGYTRLDKWKEATLAFRQCLHIEPYNSDARLRMGLTCIMTGDLTSAWRQAEILRKLDKKRAEKLHKMILTRISRFGRGKDSGYPTPVVPTGNSVRH